MTVTTDNIRKNFPLLQQMDHLSGQRGDGTAAKDQTYALYNLTQEASPYAYAGRHYDKPHIRQIAEEIGLPVATKQAIRN